jgi:hypothetical protein
MKNSRSNLKIYAQQLICIGGLRRQSLFLCRDRCSDYHLGTIWVIMGIIVTIYSFMGNFGYKYGYEHNKYQNNPGNSIPNR